MPDRVLCSILLFVFVGGFARYREGLWGPAGLKSGSTTVCLFRSSILGCGRAYRERRIKRERKRGPGGDLEKETEDMTSQWSAGGGLVHGRKGFFFPFGLAVPSLSEPDDASTRLSNQPRTNLS